MPPVTGLTGHVGFNADILTQNQTISDKVTLKKSTGFKIGQIIAGVFTLGIAAGIMQLVHSAKERGVQRNAASSLVNLRQSLHEIPPGKDFTTELKMCGSNVRLHQLSNNKLTATIDGHEIDVPFTASKLAERLEIDMLKNARFFDKDEIFALLEKKYDEVPMRSENSRFRMLCLTYLEHNCGFDATELSSMSTALLRTFVATSLNDPTFDKARMLSLNETVANAYRINSEECLELLQQLEQNNEKPPIDISKIATWKSTGAIIFGGADAQDVRNLAADLVLNRNTSVFDKNTDKFGETSGARLRDTLVKHAAVISKLIDNPDLLNEVSEDVRPALQELMTTVKDNIPSFFRNAVTVAAAFQKAPLEDFKELEDSINKSVQESIGNLQQIVNESFEEVFSVQPQNEEEPSSSVASKKEQTLDDMLESAATDMKSNGYGKFMKDVMSRYFTSLSDVDKRAVIAAGIRFAGPNDSKAKQLGAILKGAGPIMQKMLQGINTTKLDPDIAIALKDMKDNLAPIDDDMIKAYLSDIVDRSNGQIQKIEVVKSLGAASVGQALLCRIFSQEKPEGEECVVKMLRPDVQLRAGREQKIFEEVAKTIPGMEETFKGQIARIREELDLRQEAEHIKQGAVYNGMTGDSLQSMKLHPLSEPTTTTMVLEKAPGTTLNKYLEGCREQLDNVLKTSGLDENSTEPAVLSARDVMDKREALDKLYKDLSVRQQHLLGLVNAWVTEGIYGHGFYHGDLHSGNIMTDEKQLTVIDFGNATHLTTDQQCEVTRMMAAASVGDVKVFVTGFRSLLSDAGKAKFDQNEGAIREMLGRVLHMGINDKDTGKRIGVALIELQKLGLEAPGPIFNFSQCQLRLQAAVDEINSLMTMTKKTMADLWKCNSKICSDPVLDFDNWMLMSMSGASPEKMIQVAKQLIDDAPIDDKAQRQRLEKAIMEGGEDFKTYLVPYMEKNPDFAATYKEFEAAQGEEKTVICNTLAKMFCSDKSMILDELSAHLERTSDKPVELQDFCDVMGSVVEENLSVSARRIGLFNLGRFIQV